jgi:hypothetical protein
MKNSIFYHMKILILILEKLIEKSVNKLILIKSISENSSLMTYIMKKTVKEQPFKIRSL